MNNAVVDDERDELIDIKMVLLGLCGAHDVPTGRRCFRKAGHEGRCSFLRVSERGPRAVVTLPDARRGHDG